MHERIGSSGEQRSEIEQKQFRVVHDVPLSAFLDTNNKENPIQNDMLSVYSYAVPGGTEYVAVFPPLPGTELHRRLQILAPTKQNIVGAYSDMGAILQDTRLQKLHAGGLGSPWATFYSSIPHQRDVYHDAVKIEDQLTHQQRIQTTRNMLTAVEALSQSQVEEAPRIKEILEQVKAMLTQNAPVDKMFLTQFFSLQFPSVDLTPREPQNHSNGKAWKKEEHGYTTRLLTAANRKAGAHYDRKTGIRSFDEDALERRALAYVHRSPKDTALLYQDGDYFVIPKDDSFHHVKIDRQTHKNYVVTRQNEHTSLFVTIDRDSSTLQFSQSKESFKQTLDTLVHQRPGRAIVPIVRIREASGARGFVFGDEEPHRIPHTVVKEIVDHTDACNVAARPAEPAWLSDMVGVEMMVASHPSIYDIPDAWSAIWKKGAIHMSTVMGATPHPSEPKQINGPVQAGIIALVAFAQYPEQFDHFVNNLIAVSKG